MALFEYKGEDAAKLVLDARDVMEYSYHGFIEGFDDQYNKTGDDTVQTLGGFLFGNEDAQGIFGGKEGSEQRARDKIEDKGWTVISPEQLGLSADSVDEYGTFHGETIAFMGAQADVLGKYDDDGNLVELAISFRGTTGPREGFVGDLIVDLFDYSAFVIDGQNYAMSAFDDLLTSVASFAEDSGLSGDDLIMTGHSLGSMGITSLAEVSDTAYDGFYQNTNYITFANGYIVDGGASVLDSGAEILNIDFENDPVPGVVEESGGLFNNIDLYGNDTEYEQSMDNMVIYTDFYARDSWGEDWGDFGLLNPESWTSHAPNFMYDAVDILLESSFYEEMERDSTIIVSGVSDVNRGSIWVHDKQTPQPHNHADTNAFIIGSQENDLLRDGSADDSLDGMDGNDRFYIQSGNDVVMGGSGTDRVELQGHISEYLVSKDGAGNIVLDGGSKYGIETLNSVEQISDASGTTYNVTATGLVAGSVVISFGMTASFDTSGSVWTDYLASQYGIDSITLDEGITDDQVNSFLKGDLGNPLDSIAPETSSAGRYSFWDKLFMKNGTSGNDSLSGNWGDNVFNPGDGADSINGKPGNDTVTYYTSQDGVSLNLADGTGTAGDAEGDTYSSIENVIGSNFNDMIKGDNGDNVLEGKNGADRLIGGNGDDTLLGGKGDDLLKGGKGNDILTGGAGNDTFFFNVGKEGEDVITDFQEGDLIMFDDAESSINSAWVMDHAYQDGDNIIIEIQETTITIENTDYSSLDHSDFLFV